MNVKIEHEIIIKADKDVEGCLKLVAIFSEAMMKKTLLLVRFLLGW